MAKILETPPILHGKEKQQIQQLRDYLQRLVKSLNEQEANRHD